MVSPDNRWHPGIGDPTAMGWATVVAYAAAAALCAVCAKREARGNGRARRFWFALALIMLCLGINKELDLQSWLTEVGRDLAIAKGWYDSRRVVQGAFIASLALAGALAQVWLYRTFRDLGAAARVALLGLALVMVFVLVRAAGFHHVDAMLHVELEGLRINWIIELGAIAIIVAGAAARLRRPQSRFGDS